MTLALTHVMNRSYYRHEIAQMPSAPAISQDCLDRWLAKWRELAFLDEPLSNFIREQEWENDDFQQFISWAAANDWRTQQSNDSYEWPSWAHHLPHILEHWDHLNSGLPDRSEGFTRAYLPFVRYALQQIETRRPQPFAWAGITEIQGDMANRILNQINQLCGRVMILELNQARTQNRLTGESAEERFQYFVTQILVQEETWQAYFWEYQVMARLLDQLIDREINNICQFLERLNDDANQIKASFLDSGTWHLAHLELGLSDAHRNGQSVHILTFRAGERQRKVVYKPRSLAVDQAFYQFLAWIECEMTTQLAVPNLVPELALIERDGYGWCTFVAASPCKNQAEAHAFFWRNGALLAVFHLLQATDFHMENVIASGAYPVPIDLESLWQNQATGLDSDQAAQKAMRWNMANVTRVGALPQFIWAKNGQAGINISALGDGKAQTVEAVNSPAAGGTDHMKLTKGQSVMAQAKNLPKMGDEVLNILDYRQDLIDGFSTVYRFFAGQKQALCQPNGPLAQLRQVPIRAIMRPTRDYGLILKDGTHPDFLRQGVYREFLLDALWPLSRGSQDHFRLIASEKRALRFQDVPLFMARCDSRDLWTDQDENLPDFFNQSCWDLHLERMAHWDEKELGRQIDVIELSLANLDPYAIKKISAPEARPVSYLTQRLHRWVDQLIDCAFEGNQDVSWLVPTQMQQKLQIQPASADLYEGLAGISLFLGQYSAVYQNQKAHELAQKGMQTISDLLAETAYLPVGGFSSPGSAVYLFLLSERLGLKAPKGWAEDWVQKTLPTIAMDTTFDLIGGSAGSLILAMRGLELTQNPLFTKVATACFDHLVENASALSSGFAWRNPQNSTPLLGFSHGTAGIAWALATYMAHDLPLSKPQRAHSIIEGALAFERAHYLADQQNWPDLRDLNGDPTHYRDHHNHLRAWCHGAPGIALSRWLMGPIWPDTELERELAEAFHSTLAHPLSLNMSICHGLLGNLWIADRIAAHFENRDGQHKVREQLQQFGGLIDNDRPPSGLPHQLHSPTLFNGIAGMGLALLAMMGHSVPCPLWLEI